MFRSSVLNEIFPYMRLSNVQSISNDKRHVHVARILHEVGEAGGVITGQYCSKNPSYYHLFFNFHQMYTYMFAGFALTLPQQCNWSIENVVQPQRSHPKRQADRAGRIHDRTASEASDFGSKVAQFKCFVHKFTLHLHTFQKVSAECPA